MNLKTRKIKFIQEFFQLESEDAISRFEDLLKEEKDRQPDNFKPMTVDALNKRISESIKDSESGRVTEVNELLSQIQKWK